MEKSIVVPWDFSKKAEASFLHAIIISSLIPLPITLLHIVRKSSEIESAQQNLNIEADKLRKKHDITIYTHCMVGKLYLSIKQFVDESNSSMVVMPLHNVKKAIKVITGSKVPFYLIQDFPKSDKITDMVVPIDHYDRNRIQLNWVMFLSSFFKSNINIIKPFINNNSKNMMMKRNIFFAKQIMDSKNVVYGIRTGKRGVKFGQTINDFTKEINADLIFMMTYNLKDYIKVAEKENTTVPIMCLNSRSVKIVPDRY